MIRIGMEHKLCDRNFELLKEAAVCNTLRADNKAFLFMAILHMTNKSVLEENVVRPIYDVNFKISHIDEMLDGVKKKPSQGRLCLPFLDFSLIGEGSYERGFLVKVRLYYFQGVYYDRDAPCETVTVSPSAIKGWSVYCPREARNARLLNNQVASA
jgi:hypothetical protein